MRRYYENNLYLNSDPHPFLWKINSDDEIEAIRQELVEARKKISFLQITENSLLGQLREFGITNGLEVCSHEQDEELRGKFAMSRRKTTCAKSPG